MKQYFYKTREDITRYGISLIEIFEDDLYCIPISENEYLKAMEDLEAEAKAEAEEAAEEELAYIEQLEKENAALLFQVLTGEAFEDD